MLVHGRGWGLALGVSGTSARLVTRTGYHCWLPLRMARSTKQTIWSDSDALVCLAPQNCEVAFRGAGFCWRSSPGRLPSQQTAPLAECHDLTRQREMDFMRTALALLPLCVILTACEKVSSAFSAGSPSQAPAATVSYDFEINTTSPDQALKTWWRYLDNKEAMEHARCQSFAQKDAEGFEVSSVSTGWQLYAGW